MNVSGIGTDIIEIRRIRDVIERHGQRFLDRHFTRKEQLYCLEMEDGAIRFAGRFAAKEALLKALGTGIGEASWLDFEILPDDSGKPIVHTSLNNPTFLLSISHCREYATATALLIY